MGIIKWILSFFKAPKSTGLSPSGAETSDTVFTGGTKVAPDTQPEVVPDPPVEAKPEPKQTKKKNKAQLTANFHISEFACHDGTQVPDELYDNVLDLAKNLQILRDILGKPISISSGYRTEAYNRKIGGAKKSQHVQALAADLKVKGMSSSTLAMKIEKLIAEGTLKKGGVGTYPTFTHYDTRGTNARWSGTRKKN